METEAIKAEETAEVLETVKELDKMQREDKADEVSVDVDASRAEAEMKQGYREVEVAPYGKLHIHKPTVEDDYQARIVYSETFTDLMMSGKLKTLEEMEKDLKARAGAVVIDSDVISDLRKEYSEAMSELLIARSEYKAKPTVAVKKRIKALELDQATTRKALLKAEATRNKYVSMTIDGQAEQRQLVEKVYRCVKYPNGKRVWETPEDLTKEKDSEPVATIVFEFIAFSQGIDPRVLRNIPGLLEEVGDDIDLDT